MGGSITFFLCVSLSKFPWKTYGTNKQKGNGSLNTISPKILSVMFIITFSVSSTLQMCESCSKLINIELITEIMHTGEWDLHPGE